MQRVLAYGQDGCGQMIPLIRFKTGKAVNQEKLIFMHGYQRMDGKEWTNQKHIWRSSVNMVIDTIQLSYSSGFCSGFIIPFQANFRQSFRGSISNTTQCIESDILPNESLGRDLQFRVRHLYVRMRLNGVMCVTKCQQASNYFSVFPY